jgi:flagellar protein FliS
MNRSNPYALYRQTSIETATGTRLVIMLYDGAIRFLTCALPEMRARHYEAQNRYIGRAQAIIAHLRGTLDFQRGGAIADLLSDYYVILYDALTDANIYDKIAKVELVIHGLREVREAWMEVDKRAQAQKAEADKAMGQSHVSRSDLIAA